MANIELFMFIKGINFSQKYRVVYSFLCLQKIDYHCI